MADPVILWGAFSPVPTASLPCGCSEGSELRTETHHMLAGVGGARASSGPLACIHKGCWHAGDLMEGVGVGSS